VGRDLEALDGGRDPGADGVEVVERPVVEQVQIVAAQHARADPRREVAEDGLGVEVAQRRAGGERAGLVEELLVEGQGGDDLHPAREPREAGAVGEVELEVARLDDTRAVGDDVDRVGAAAAQVGAGDDPAVGPEAEAQAVVDRDRDLRGRRRGGRRRRRRRRRRVGAGPGQLGLEGLEARGQGGQLLGAGRLRGSVGRGLGWRRRHVDRRRLGGGGRGQADQREQGGEARGHRAGGQHDPCRPRGPSI
jgi:hypothetical protein